MVGAGVFQGGARVRCGGCGVGGGGVGGVIVPGFLFGPLDAFFQLYTGLTTAGLTLERCPSGGGWWWWKRNLQ